MLLAVARVLVGEKITPLFLNSHRGLQINSQSNISITLINVLIVASLGDATISAPHTMITHEEFDSPLTHKIKSYNNEYISYRC